MKVKCTVSIHYKTALRAFVRVRGAPQGIPGGSAGDPGSPERPQGIPGRSPGDLPGILDLGPKNIVLDSQNAGFEQVLTAFFMICYKVLCFWTF